MKTLTISLWLVCIGMVHAQLNAMPNDCTFGPSPEDNPASQISAQLPAGVWNGENQHGQSISLHFFENGLVQWLTYCSGQSTSSRLFSWECMPGHRSDAILAFTDWKTGAYSVYDIQANCNSISLLNNQYALELDYTAAAGKEEIQRTKKILTGNWENTTYPFDFEPVDKSELQDAYLTYKFLPSGRFVRKIGNKARQITEHGNWVISNDGLHLVLSFDNGKATVAQLKYVRMDELVIHHLLSCQDPAFNTAEKDFFFNRY